MQLREYDYMGFTMTSGVEGDREHGFVIASQTIRSLTEDLTDNVPIDGIAAGRFSTQDNAFDASFERIRDAIDKRLAASA